MGRLVAELGVPVLDADQLAREVVEPGRPALAEVAAAWPQAIGPDGKVHRKRLAEIVFADAAQRLRLEAIMHPRIQALAGERLAALARRRARPRLLRGLAGRGRLLLDLTALGLP